MTIATLPEFTLHLDSRRLEMSQVKVVRTRGRDRDTVHLIGHLKTEAFWEERWPGFVVVSGKVRRDRDAIIRLLGTGTNEVMAFEGDSLIGFVAWDDHTNARKLPDFMRRLLGVSP